MGGNLVDSIVLTICAEVIAEPILSSGRYWLILVGLAIAVATRPRSACVNMSMVRSAVVVAADVTVCRFVPVPSLSTRICQWIL
jgi:hypothetical protein